MEKLDHEEKNKMLFFSLVEQWRFQAWMNLGKIKNPVTDKIERNLELAKTAIDMLDMIKEKTQGNLTDEETRLLNQILSDLKLNYVDEYEKEKREKQQQAEKSEERSPSNQEGQEMHTASEAKETSTSRKGKTTTQKKK